MLKALHVPFTFAPDPIGGTEIYVESLARELGDFSVESVVAAPSSRGVDETYLHDGLRVHRFRSAPESKNMLRELYGLGDAEASKAFGQILDEEAPEVVHLHAFTRAVSRLLVREAKRRRIPVLFTYHTPTVSCSRGTLMLLGTEVCDGFLSAERCTNCVLQGMGLPRLISIRLSQIPGVFAKLLERLNVSGGGWTALRMAELIRLRNESFRELMIEVDGVVALREWVRTLLIRNGVKAAKIFLSPHGLSPRANTCEPLVDPEVKPLRVAFFGRAERVKGIDTVIRAVRSLPDLEIALDLYGVAQSTADSDYQTLLKSEAAGDGRIQFCAPVPNNDVVPLLRRYHLLAVPSRWLETGPLVILESFAAGTPVVGSNLGGIAEWIMHGQNGLLVSFDDVAGWAAALRRCAEDRRFLAGLRRGIRQPRSSRAVAQEMAELYQNVADRMRLADKTAKSH